MAAKQTLELKTASGVVNIAAAKKVVLAVSGGASITIEGGQFTAQCPGKITVKAGKKAMVGGGSLTQMALELPKCVPNSFDQAFIAMWGGHRHSCCKSSLQTTRWARQGDL